VLVHGGGVDAAAFSWKHLLPALASDYRVYAPDLPGYGASERVPGVATTADYVPILEGFLATVGAERPAVVGISMGGGIGLGFALGHPGRVSGLVLIDSYGLGGAVPGGRLGYWFVRLPFVTGATWALLRRSRRLTRLSVRAVAHPDNVTDELVEDVHRLVARPGAGRTFHEFQLAEVGPRGLRTNYLDRLPELAVPTLLIHGETDPLVPSAWAVRAATLIPDATLRVLPECGHMPPRERPDAVERLLREFLAGG
jgi:pimeloyl-ACP methyl ester carboxylesterase